MLRSCALLASIALAGCPPASVSVQRAVEGRPLEEKVPSTIDPAKRYPLLLVLHGLGASPGAVRHYYQTDLLAKEMGFLIAYPSGGQKRSWSATGPDDIAYLDAVIDDLSARYPVDPKRIFVGGISNGGYMAYRYACERAERVAAIVVQAGVMRTDTSTCKPREPVAVLHAHGTSDRVLPYDGGLVLGTGPKVLSAHESTGAWVSLDHCDPTPDTHGAPLDLIADEDPPIGTETTVEKWGGCRGVELWTVHGGSHDPPLRHPAWERAIGSWLLAHPKP
jgi:polyhydroxybutyrate depolymerase